MQPRDLVGAVKRDESGDGERIEEPEVAAAARSSPDSDDRRVDRQHVRDARRDRQQAVGRLDDGEQPQRVAARHDVAEADRRQGDGADVQRFDRPLGAERDARAEAEALDVRPVDKRVADGEPDDPHEDGGGKTQWTGRRQGASAPAHAAHRPCCDPRAAVDRLTERPPLRRVKHGAGDVPEDKRHDGDARRDGERGHDNATPAVLASSRVIDGHRRRGGRCSAQSGVGAERWQVTPPSDTALAWSARP